MTDTTEYTNEVQSASFLALLQKLLMEGAASNKLFDKPYSTALMLTTQVQEVKQAIETWAPLQEAYAMAKKSGSVRLGIFEKIRERIDINKSRAAAVDLVDEMSRHLDSVHSLVSLHGNIVLAHYRTLVSKDGDFAVALRSMEDDNLRSELKGVVEESNVQELIEMWKKLQERFAAAVTIFDLAMADEDFTDAMVKEGLPAPTKTNPLLFLGLGKFTEKGKKRADGTRGLSVNAKEGPRLRGERRITEDPNEALDFHGIVHFYKPHLEGGYWEHIGDPKKQPWEQTLSHDLTVSFSAVQAAAKRSDKDLKDAVVGFVTITGLHVIRSKAIAVDGDVPITIPMTDTERQELASFLNIQL